MSRSVDLFVDHGDDPHQLLVMLGSSIHGPATQRAPGRWQLQLGSQLVADVYRHPYVDDGPLRLSHYPWVVSVRTGQDGSLGDHQATIALRMVADDLRAHRCRVLLVLDLQYRIDLGPDPDDEPDPGLSGPDDPVTQLPAGDDPADPADLATTEP